MKRFFLPILSAVLGISASAFGCLNDYDPNGAEATRSRSLMEQLQKHVLKEPWTVRRDRLQKALAAGGNYRVKNDLAVALAHTGQAGDAVKLLEQLEAEKPGLYMTAANLGTAYELAGDNQKALEWIRRGIALNPDAHEGTEWLHVRILEAKLALVEHPKWLASHSIPEVAETGNRYVVSATGNRGQRLSREQVKDALIYQLHERMQFVQPPDAIVGSLLLDLAALISIEPSGPGGALDVLKLSTQYLDNLQDVDSLQGRAELQYLTTRLHRGHRSVVAESFWLTTAGAYTLVIILIFGLARRIRRRTLSQKAPAAA